MTNLNLNINQNDVELIPENHPESQEPVVGAEILIEQLYKFYGEVKVLEDLNLHIQPGEFLAIVGRSGCGKSTLLRLIAQLEKASFGEIKFKSARHLREGITNDDIRVMFQDPRLLPWRNILQNVQRVTKIATCFGRRIIRESRFKRKSGTMAFTALWWTTTTYRPSRALSHTPRILLLDEPLGALDALTRLEMQSLIERLWKEQGFTAILVTHDVSEAVQLADRIILLDKGQIAQSFQVNLPRPRKKSITFAQLEQQVLDAVLAT